jgi:hypothetical protein
MVRRRVPQVLVLILAAVMATGCARGPADDDWSLNAVASAPDAPVQARLVNSQLGVGRNRIAIGLFDASGSLLSTAEGARLRLFTIQGDTGTFAQEVGLTRIQLGEGPDHVHADGALHVHDPLATVYVTTIDLDRADWWGGEISATVGGKKYQHLRLRFRVRQHTSEPGVGDAAPATRQPTTADTSDLRSIDSSASPRPSLHDITIADALRSRRPAVVAFATPAFCQTRFCGPVVDNVLAPIAERYQGRIHAIHIEPYDVPSARAGDLHLAPAMDEWHLQTEPWVFVLGADGRVVAKFEGIMDVAEVSAAVEQALAAAR